MEKTIVFLIIAYFCMVILGLILIIQEYQENNRYLKKLCEEFPHSNSEIESLYVKVKTRYPLITKQAIYLICSVTLYYSMKRKITVDSSLQISIRYLE
jgi:hypothetical protein